MHLVKWLAAWNWALDRCRGRSLPLVGVEECESSFSRVTNKNAVAGKCLARHFAALQNMTHRNISQSVLWIAGPSNRAYGLKKPTSDMAPSRTLSTRDKYFLEENRSL